MHWRRIFLLIFQCFQILNLFILDGALLNLLGERKKGRFFYGKVFFFLGILKNLDLQIANMKSWNSLRFLMEKFSENNLRSWILELNSIWDMLLKFSFSAAATPKQIRELMQVEGLTNDEVKSHLQVGVNIEAFLFQFSLVGRP